MEERIITDMFGNELRIGDKVCFAGGNGNWRTSPSIVREEIKDISYAKNVCQDGCYYDWLVFDGNKKKSPKSVVKCY